VPRIHLDSNVLIGLLTPHGPADRAVRHWMLGGDTLGVSAFAWGEFCCGPAGAPLPEPIRQLARRIVGEPEPLDAACAELAASLFNATGRRRALLGDCFVAAAALRAEAALATSNVADFERFLPLGLQVVAV
jgi:predicted nucleic acid-binding protein